MYPLAHRFGNPRPPPPVLAAARSALASGRYQGIGELHLIAGFAPSPRTHNDAIDGLVALAVEFDVPLNIHAEASSARLFEPLCRRHPRARIVWADTGGVLPAAEVADLLRACPNVWIDLSAKDPGRYGALHPITGDDGRLLPAWEALVLEYDDRVMIGSDPWFRATGGGWDEPNVGWERIGDYLAFHRRWPRSCRRKWRSGSGSTTRCGSSAGPHPHDVMELTRVRGHQ